jgi:hypothetical protein
LEALPNQSTGSDKKRKIQDWYDSSSTSTIDELFAKAIYTSTIAFSAFETPEWKAFFGVLGYKPPAAKQLSGTLLDNCYKATKAEVLQVADSSNTLQICSDGSANIARTRVENTSFIVQGIHFYWKTIGIGSISAGAEWTVKNVIQDAKDITQSNLSRWTAFCSDTCSTQRAVWQRFNTHQDTKHVHTIGCDSHGTQLIFKDLLAPGKDQDREQIVTPIGDFFQKGPNALVTYFAKANKQLAFLQGIMIICYTGIIKALVAIVITR